MQLAAIEGENGSGKQTLARFLHSRSPLSKSTFTAPRCARVAGDGSGSRDDGRIHLSRSRRSACITRPGIVAGSFESDAGSTAGPCGSLGFLGCLVATNGGTGASDARSCFPIDRGALCRSTAAATPRGYRPVGARAAVPHLRALSAAACDVGSRCAGTPVAAQLTREHPRIGQRARGCFA